MKLYLKHFLHLVVRHPTMRAEYGFMHMFCSNARIKSVQRRARTATHWEIEGRFRKRVVLANVPSFRFSFRGNIRRNHPFGNHPFVNTKKGHWEIRGRFPKGWFWRTYPRSGFRSGGTSAKTTLLETTLLRNPEQPCKSDPCRFSWSCSCSTLLGAIIRWPHKQPWQPITQLRGWQFTPFLSACFVFAEANSRSWSQELTESLILSNLRMEVSDQQRAQT